jgi:hypothetical protein
VETQKTGAFSRSKEIKMFKNRFLLVLGILSLLLVAMVISFPLSSRPTSMERDQAADEARWTAMGEYYQKQAVENANRLHGREADAARWTAMAEYYLSERTLVDPNAGLVIDQQSELFGK